MARKRIGHTPSELGSADAKAAPAQAPASKAATLLRFAEMAAKEAALAKAAAQRANDAALRTAEARELAEEVHELKLACVRIDCNQRAAAAPGCMICRHLNRMRSRRLCL